MAAMISKAILATGNKINTDNQQAELTVDFEDSNSISNWAKASVADLIEAKILSGMTDHTFAPDAKASRAQAVVTLKRMLQYLHFIN